jgi:hypothetical protein
MQPGQQFTVRQCEKYLLQWYVEGPWDKVPEEESTAFRHKAFPEKYALEIAQRQQEIMMGHTSLMHEFWVSKLPEEIKQIVEKPYGMI